MIVLHKYVSFDLLLAQVLVSTKEVVIKLNKFIKLLKTLTY